MKLVISPAKSLNYESELPTSLSTQSCFLSESQQLNSLLKKKSAKTLSALMHISPNLGQLNYERNQEWSIPFTSKNARPAIYAFNGDVYRGIEAYTISDSKLERLQDSVRIISRGSIFKIYWIDCKGVFVASHKMPIWVGNSVIIRIRF